MRNKFITILIALTWFSASCENPLTSTQVTELDSSNYLFVEYWTAITGPTSQEQCDNFVYIDGPGYSYEENILRSSFDVDLTETNAILGYGKSVIPPVGSGIFSNLHSIKDLPYTPDCVDFCQTLTINHIDSFGTISALVNGKTVSLAVGQEWADSITDNSDSSCQKVTSYRLSNFGFIGSGQISLPEK
jgi:hypothetical protein